MRHRGNWVPNGRTRGVVFLLRTFVRTPLIRVYCTEEKRDSDLKDPEFERILTSHSWNWHQKLNGLLQRPK